MKSTHPVVNAVKTVGSSPLFLIAVIAYTAQTVLSAIGMTMGNAESFAHFMNALGTLGQPGTTGAFLNVNFVSPISILLIIGLWMIFAAAANSQSDTMSTAGLTMIKVVMIITLVLFCIVAAMALLLLLLGVGIAAAMEEAFAAPAIIIAVLVVAAAFVIFYVAKIIQSIDSVKHTIATGQPSNRVSVFIGVLCIINGGITFLTVAGTCVAFPLLIDGIWLGESLCAGLANVLFGAVIFSYRGKMKELLALSPLERGSVFIPGQIPGSMVRQDLPTAPWSAGVSNTPGAQPAAEPQPFAVTCPHCGCCHSAQDRLCPGCGAAKEP